jgi:hypothetical protein
MKELAPNLIKFYELAKKGDSVLAESILNISNPAERRVHMQAGLLHPEIWKAAAKAGEWDKFIDTSHVVDRPDLVWEAYFDLTMEDIRDGEPVDKAVEPLFL